MLKIIKITPNSFFYSTSSKREKQDEKTKEVTSEYVVEPEREMNFASALTEEQYEQISTEDWIKGFEEFINKNETNEQSELFKKELISLQRTGVERDRAGITLLANYTNLPSDINREAVTDIPYKPSLQLVGTSEEDSLAVQQINSVFPQYQMITDKRYVSILESILVFLSTKITLREFLDAIKNAKNSSVSEQDASEIRKIITNEVK